MSASCVFHRFDEVESTNDIALEMGRRGAPEGSVVVARKQTKGRGRLGREWWDEKDASVLMSVLLRPDVPAVDVPKLAFVAGVAVADAVASMGCPDVALKWPNDVLARGKKVSGILVECENDAAAVGIGVNVNQASFPEELASTATSVLLETGNRHDVNELASRIAMGLLSDYSAYLSRGFEEIAARWRKYMWGVGQAASVCTGGETVRGIIAGIDSQCCLLLLECSGAVRKVVAAESICLSHGQQDF